MYVRYSLSVEGFKELTIINCLNKLRDICNKCATKIWNDKNQSYSPFLFSIFFCMITAEINNNSKPIGHLMCQQVLQRNDTYHTYSGFMCLVRWLISTQTAIIYTVSNCWFLQARRIACYAALPCVFFLRTSKKL